MANVNAPFGLRPVQSIHSTVPVPTRYYTIPAADTNDMFIGDLVKATGTLGLNELGEYCPVCTVSAAGDASIGVIVGFVAHKTYENQVHRTNRTLRTAIVADDPDQIFEIQSDGTFAVGDCEANANIVYAAGSTVTGQSATVLGESTVGTENSKHLRIIGFLNQADNLLGLYSKVLVMLNLHQRRITTGL